MESYLQSEIEENKNYRPAEIPKLEDAFLQQAGNTVLMVVSTDTPSCQRPFGI